MKYDHTGMEAKWQKQWEEKGVFHASNDSDKPKYYTLIEFPYPSGQGLHVGHPRSYTALDIVARKRRLMGYNVRILSVGMPLACLSKILPLKPRPSRGGDKEKYRPL